MIKKGFSLLEYVMLAVILIAALVAMQYYLRRAIMGGYRAGADAFGFGRQYDPAASITATTR